ncbi:hypothetical protein D3C87_1375150 [compost metagenome]
MCGASGPSLSSHHHTPFRGEPARQSRSGLFPDTPPLYCDLILRLSDVVAVLDEMRWRAQRKSMTDPLWLERVGFPEKTQIVVPVVEEGDLALMNPCA